jgi:hypothetical protein
MGATPFSLPPCATGTPLAKTQEKGQQIKQKARDHTAPPDKAASPKGSDNLPLLDVVSNPVRSRFAFSEEDDATMPATPMDKWEGNGEEHHAINMEFQQQILETLVTEPDSGINEQDLKILSIYILLTASEFIYVLELQRAYDETRCYYSQWVISKEIKELVNSARLTAMNEDMRFTWTHVKREILNSLVDVTHTARLLTLTQLERGQSSARLWISQFTSKRALLEDKEGTSFPDVPTGNNLFGTHFRSPQPAGVQHVFDPHAWRRPDGERFKGQSALDLSQTESEDRRLHPTSPIHSEAPNRQLPSC